MIIFKYGNIHRVLCGKTQCFDWAIFNRYVKLPEGKELIQ